MNNIQRAKLDTCNRIKEFNTKHATDLATIAEYSTEIQAFTDALLVVNKAAQVQAITTGTATNAVQSAKDTMAKVTIKYALRALVKAKQIGDLILINHLDHPITYISTATKTLAVQRATDIKQTLNDNLATLTNIIPNNIDEMTNAITAYDTIKDKPTTNRNARKATGTNPLPAALTNAFNAIESMNDLVVSYFAETNTALVQEFELAKQINVTGIHHSGVVGAVQQNGQALLNTTINLVGSNKTIQTDTNGRYALTKVKAGDYTIQVTTENGTIQSKTVRISKGSVETMDFEF